MSIRWSDVFTVSGGPRSRKDIIHWWERRRFLYNLFILLFYLGARLTVSALEPVGLYTGADSWSMLIPFVVGFNLVYTVCWIFELILRDASGPNHPEARHYPPWAYGSALLLTALILNLLPLSLGAGKISGALAIPQFRYAMDRPDSTELPGWYEISQFSRNQLIEAGAAVPDSCGILLRADGSYLTTNPVLPDSSSLPLDAAVIRGPGTWEVTGGNPGPWTVVLIPGPVSSSLQDFPVESVQPSELEILDNKSPHRLRLRVPNRNPFYISYSQPDERP